MANSVFAWWLKQALTGQMQKNSLLLLKNNKPKLTMVLFLESTFQAGTSPLDGIRMATASVLSGLSEVKYVQILPNGGKSWPQIIYHLCSNDPQQMEQLQQVRDLLQQSHTSHPINKPWVLNLVVTIGAHDDPVSTQWHHHTGFASVPLLLQHTFGSRACSIIVEDHRNVQVWDWISEWYIS